jgi:hypothetical protein
MTPRQIMAETRRFKYGNKPTEVDGIRFASKREAARYSELKLLERAGKISALRLQPAFPLDVNGVPVCLYRADFAYVENGRHAVEDSKGFRTDVYKIKRALMKAVHGIDVVEV